jgi:HK97 family phage portal protein
MKLRDLLIGAPSVPKPAVEAASAYLPLNETNIFAGMFSTQTTATRDEAMAIPTIARARNIICSTIASTMIDVWQKSTMTRLDPPRVINQPDPRVPGANVWSWIAEDILFFGFGYLRVTDRYAEDGRVRAAERVAPERVTVKTNSLSFEITGYLVDGFEVRNEDMKVFMGMDEGLLNRAGQTLKAGAWLERVALTYAREPAPLTVLKTTGTAMPGDRIRSVLDAWSKARKERSTAFLNADVSIEKLGFNPSEIQLNEARQYIALELARAIGLPAWFVSGDPQSNTYSNAINQRRDLIDYSLKPLMTVIEQRLSQSDFLPSGQFARYNFAEFLRGNPLERAQVYQILSGIGAITADEIRQEEDMIP